MAYIELRISGTPKVNEGKPRRVRKTFRDTSDGRSARDTFEGGLRDVVKKYDVRYRVADRLATETFATKGAAEARRTAVKTAEDTGFAVDPAGGRMTVERLAECWLASNPGKRGSTVGRDRSALNRHILPSIGTRKIRTVRQPDVQALVNEWAKGLAPKTVDRTYGTLRAAFAYAVSAELLPRSPCHHVNLPKATPRRRKVVTQTDVVALANAIDARYESMVYVGALLGLRWGEVAALRVSSLDLLGRTLTVSENVGRDERGRLVLGPPKSHAGNRIISMPEVLAEILADHLATMGLTAANGDEFIFPTSKGGALGYSNFRQNIWLPATVKANLKGTGFHDLRRTNATGMVHGNVDLKTAGARLGHSDPRLTLAVYAQATPAADRSAADVLGGQYADVVGFADRDRIATDAPLREAAGA